MAPHSTPIVMFGAAGRMGRMILDLAAREAEAFSIVGAVEHDAHPLLGRPLSEWIPGAPALPALTAAPPDDAPDDAIAIHFTLPDGLMRHLPWHERTGRPAVVGTTGLNDEQLEALRRVARNAPILLTPNTSLGVNALFQLAGQAARLLGPQYDIEIVEMHHRHKKDAPSGTARRLAEVVLDARGGDAEADVRHGRLGAVGERPVGEVGMHALRGGEVVGEHTVVLAGPNERIELTHRAHSRELFARGALDAAVWLRDRVGQPGLYSMDDMLG